MAALVMIVISSLEADKDNLYINAYVRGEKERRLPKRRNYDDEFLLYAYAVDRGFMRKKFLIFLLDNLSFPRTGGWRWALMHARGSWRARIFSPSLVPFGDFFCLLLY